MSGQAGNNERPQEGSGDVFRVWWTDANHPEPVMVLLRFYSEFRANLCAEQIAIGSPGVKVWVATETAAPSADASAA